MNYPLSIRTVHKKLLLRLILMGGAIAVLLGTLVWIYQHNRIDTEIIDRATHSVRLMNEEVRLYLRESGSAISKRDHGTDLHNYRVTIIAVCLAKACGLPSTEMHGLIKGAFLHDIGKLGVPDHILLKQGALSGEEFSIMQKHVIHGMDIVRRSKWLADALPVVGFHHEKFNGQGYSHH